MIRGVRKLITEKDFKKNHTYHSVIMYMDDKVAADYDIQAYVHFFDRFDYKDDTHAIRRRRKYSSLTGEMRVDKPLEVPLEEAIREVNMTIKSTEWDGNSFSVIGDAPVEEQKLINISEIFESFKIDIFDRCGMYACIPKEIINGIASKEWLMFEEYRKPVVINDIETYVKSFIGKEDVDIFVWK